MSAITHHSEQGDSLPSAGGRIVAANSVSSPNADEFIERWTTAQLPVRAFLNSFLSERSEIDDCLQEVAVLAWKKGPTGLGPDAFLGFCLNCARKIANGEIRRKYRRQRLLSPEMALSLAEAAASREVEEQAVERAPRIAALQSCLEALEPAPRRLLEIRYSQQDPTALQQEAAVSGSSIDAIYKKLERLRKLLRDCVTKKHRSTNDS
jgi:RNA polymerase sigma-70 factor (ECF subfamily)